MSDSPLICRKHGVAAPAAAPESLHAHPEVWCPACARRAGARPRVLSVWHSEDGRAEGFLIDFGATRFERTWRLVREGPAPDGSADVVDVTWHADGELFTDPAVIALLDAAIKKHVSAQDAFARADAQLGPGIGGGRV